jgi:hypothetical protein
MAPIGLSESSFARESSAGGDVGSNIGGLVFTWD